ncbi:MAG: winged helix-turn-helix transcriptional regulator [Treponema sp.]|nr:winged helix-turn-helix transcriptional regulator [Treponema sp.]
MSSAPPSNLWFAVRVSPCQSAPPREPLQLFPVRVCSCSSWLKFLQGLKEPEFRQEEEFVTIIWRKKVGNKVGNNLTKNQKLILEAIRKNPKITAIALSSIVGISERKIEENIAKLRNLGIIQRIGSTRGYWEIIAR